ncbi:bifunctional 2-polyprenyl-6-hydroxyphenol methylase/3-demethylubiquinol 3-O-methyltransferase UbiG [Niveispirillum sp.]|uniref:class I SAM-dependent methyltransferase n=1 Tax=Niveispirillum sp. TaxID=1917217 RepID=UPI001B53FA43|nr:class I SAM-dependent methyltransferase [Niveispirillum sp.]MBP7335861.1 methyltransferase domain-containing protein [Niveispirillum sp.]
MNPHVPDSDGSYLYYDGDYPWPADLAADASLHASAARQGILHDVAHYAGLTQELAGLLGRGPRVLEMACGTGRLSIPMARVGAMVTGVDASAVMLAGLARRLRQEGAEVAARVVAVQGDLLDLDLPDKRHDLVVMGFNILMLIADFDSQIMALERARDHLGPDGVLALDVVNPLVMPLGATPAPEVSYTRVNPHTGNIYTKFALVGTLDDRQVQHNHGWYDEVMPDGTIRRAYYHFDWRPLFRYELELMLKLTGFGIVRVDGDFQGSPFDAGSGKIVVVARRL